ncbi:MAG TPA: gamma-type small acid-soluble spore protein [Chondromyces sp.]|nr:gamma-type small acid-soluble spore protein [Chondromyces sp.]
MTNQFPKSNTNAQQVRQQNAQSAAGQSQQFGTEFASETDVQQVRRQNAQSAQAGRTQQAGRQAGQQFGTEFASETDVQQVRQQNAQAEARKSQNAGGAFGANQQNQ